MLLQTITVDDWRFPEYLRTELDREAHLSWRGARVGRRDPGVAGAHLSGSDCSTPRQSAPTTHDPAPVAPAFHRRLDDVRAQGFDDRFIRMWDLYLA